MKHGPSSDIEFDPQRVDTSRNERFSLSELISSVANINVQINRWHLLVTIERTREWADNKANGRSFEQ